MTREEAIEEIKNYNYNYPSGLSKECRNYIIKALEQEPRKGHWVVNKWGNISCSECGCNALYDKVYTDSSLFGKAIRIKSTFCPTCGADMREVLKDEIN